MRFLVLIVVFSLSACFDDTQKIEAYIVDVKANSTSYIAPMPEVHPFNHFNYSAEQLRSPFVEPKAEAIQEKMQQISGCLSPDPRRRKQPLEKFSLSDLTMRGTMGDTGIIWALLEASDLTLHRVSIGSYIGLYNGRITKVDTTSVVILELAPDGAGCWVEREAVIKLAGSE